MGNSIQFNAWSLPDERADVSLKMHFCLHFSNGRVSTMPPYIWPPQQYL